ncbi:hypothetical protein [Engelhardtia mirabilis]|uniref:Uncharacterized protein n=1 Tax=Engelhardtia mirabilis TaxID=2528011 RepID=A0A518BRC1_9BACT|nr:hypothetical protein Pla133_46200 [Planctomycetes bacterium Pla133]QDV03826.1 hypothetical protein Pla86_46180 [Planctomycetes bacterium Pla86]
MNDGPAPRELGPRPVGRGPSSRGFGCRPSAAGGAFVSAATLDAGGHPIGLERADLFENPVSWRFRSPESLLSAGQIGIVVAAEVTDDGLPDVVLNQGGTIGFRVNLLVD